MSYEIELFDITEWWIYGYNKVAVAGSRLVPIGMKVH